MLFWRFIAPNASLGPELVAAHNLFLVALSFFVASLGGYAALEVVERMARAPSPRARRRWLAAGAVAMGSGIWSMHFIGMLAFSLPIAVRYDLTVTLLSMVPALFASAMGLHFMDRPRISGSRLQAGGLLMALGIGGMHYTGMEAMRMDARLAYTPVLFALSILVAHVLATLALYIKFFPGGATFPLRKVASAGAMGSAVACMHYTAMHAARFYPGAGRRGTPAGVFEPRWMALAIAVVTSSIIAIAIVATLVDRHTTALVAARDEAVRTDRAKSDFLAAMSHEIRTPLNGVIGMADLLAAGPLAPEQRDQAETIRRSGEALLAILNDILDWAKIEAGRLEVERLPVDAWVVAADTVALYRSQVRDLGGTLTLDWPEPVPRRVLADPMRVRQVLLNLVSNAVKFAPGGSVTVTAGVDGGRLAIGVRDTGIGMDEAQRARLFKPFTQGDASTTRRFGGTGLGLAITARLLEAMDGTIAVASAPGCGSTFTFRLPLALEPSATATAADTAAPAPPGAPTATGPDRRRRVLVAEDSPVNRKVAQAMLQHLEADVECVDDGAQAVAATARAAYDLVLLDISMPVLDGLAAARAIRAREAAGDGPRLRLVALTANAFAADRQACEAAGMDGFLAKPITLATLRAVLQALPGSGG